MTLIYGVDTAQIPVIGSTDESGTLVINKSEWFPHLYNLPEMTMMGSCAECEIGSFYISDYIVNNNIIIVVEYDNRTQAYNTNIVAGNNNIELIWNPNEERITNVNNSYESDYGLLIPYSSEVTPGSDPNLLLSQNYPNPYN